jgi:MFS family permease
LTETTTTYEVDDAGLQAVLSERNDVVLEEETSPGHFGCTEGPFGDYLRTVSTDPLGNGRHRVTETTRWSLAVPIWAPLFRPLVRRLLSRRRAPPPPRDRTQEPPVPPWWSPPARLEARSAEVLSLLCGLSLLAGYLGTVITQTITFAADEFGESNAAQGTTLAAVRIGVLASLALMVLADRRGRQKLLVLCAVGGTLATAAGALAPDLVVLGGTQTVSRAFSTALALLIAVVAAEEMPAGGRAYAASVLAMTGALGAGMAVLLLPVADLGDAAWRLVYVAPLVFMPMFLAVGRRLPESRRFIRTHAKATMAGHRGRLALLAVSAFFALLFLTPNSQFQNEFLRDEHGFSALQLTVFTVVTNTPAGIGIVVGGRLADTRGRRRVGAIGMVGGAVLLALAYQVSGVWLVLASLVGSIVAAVTVPALAVYGPELFPTSLRGRANGYLSLAGVLGSGVGLAIAGRLADHFGRFGPGIALLGVGPLVVAALVMTLYPETAHLELEELNPEDAPATALATPLT